MTAKKRLAGLLAAVLTTTMMTGAASADGVIVTADRLNVRAKPEATGNTIGVAEKGDELGFVSEYGDWIQVKYKGQIGFVTEEYVKLDRDELKEDVEENTRAYSGKGETTERVNIRSLPMTDASIVTVAAKKATVEITGTCGEWYKVKYGSKSGYLLAQYVTLKSGSSATVKPEATKAPVQGDTIPDDGVLGVVTVRVNMRKEPSTDSAIIGVLSEGDPICIMSETDRWYWIYTEGKQGYIVKTCAEPIGENVRPTATVKPTAAPTAKPDDSVADDIYDKTKTGTATARVNMRKTPSTSGQIVMVVAKGAKVAVEGENGGWYKVSLGGKTGYVSGSYLAVTDQSPEATVKPEATAQPTVKPTEKPAEDTIYSEAKAGRTTARVNMRAGASTGASVVVVVDKNTGITLTGEQGGFYRAAYGRYIGYISKSYVQIVTAEEVKPEEDKKEEGVKETLYSSAKTGKTTLRVNMRREPEGEVQYVLPANTKVSMIGERGGWYKVKYSGSTGYISKSYVQEYDEEEEKTSGEGTKGYITEASVNMRKGPGTGYGVVKVLKRGAEIRFYELKDGWYLIKSGSDTGYVSSKYVSKSQPEEESGSTPGGSSSESGGKVILSDWFKGEVASVFARGDEATVTDVKTGLKFKATRTGGYYHADAQPSSSSETKIMYQIYGNKWQWTRRAVWVTVDGKTYAASMNGMPHGETDVISGNNFDGCFCIHFLNSKTHAGDRVDSAHQDCVQEAYKAGK